MQRETLLHLVCRHPRDVVATGLQGLLERRDTDFEHRVGKQVELSVVDAVRHPGLADDHHPSHTFLLSRETPSRPTSPARLPTSRGPSKNPPPWLTRICLQS